jgi:predicted enzyme related to lactoylglutathione lyase
VIFIGVEGRMQSINGLGGAFIFTNDPKRLAEWYTTCLGLEFETDNSGGMFWLVFWALNPDDPSRKFDTTFAIMQASTSISHPKPDAEPESMYGDQSYMLNLRTHDLQALLQSLESKGVPVIRREEMIYGKFAWIRDFDGNRLELYQPSQISESHPS